MQRSLINTLVRGNMFDSIFSAYAPNRAEELQKKLANKLREANMFSEFSNFFPRHFKTIPPSSLLEVDFKEAFSLIWEQRHCSFNIRPLYFEYLEEDSRSLFFSNTNTSAPHDPAENAVEDEEECAGYDNDNKNKRPLERHNTSKLDL